MCGIAGHFIYSSEALHCEIEQSLELIKHRGPDSTDFIKNSNWSIGVNRLSITDPKSNNTQPLVSADRRYYFVYNGQVYNYLSLKKDLEKLAFSFSTNCDSEVLFKGFIAWGNDIFARVEGMFACAIWDDLKKSWLLARDPLGIKPLYYLHSKDAFFFASEIKALLPNLNNKEINYDKIPDYLATRYVSGEETLFKNIFKVPPGTVLEFQSAENRISSKAYIELNQTNSQLSFSERLEEFSKTLEASVEMTIPKEVDFSALVSGGLDSSLVASLINKSNYNYNMYFFDNGYDNKEKESALFIANELKSKLNLVHADKDDFKLLPAAIRALEEPLGDSIIIPNLKLLKVVAQKSKVVLVGEGADELLGGYAHHYIYKMSENFRKFYNADLLKFIFKNLPLTFLNKLIPYPANLDRNSLENKIEQLSRLQNFGDLSYSNLFSEQELHELNPDFKNLEANKAKTFQNLILYDLKNWLPNYNLLRLDKLGMSQSLEVRVPYLNLAFIKSCLRLMDGDLIDWKGNRKRILQKSAADKFNLPKRIAYRKKHPFTYKESALENNEYSQFCNNYLTKDFYKDLGFNSTKSNELIANKDFLSQKKKTSLLNLAIWKSEFFS